MFCGLAGKREAYYMSLFFLLDGLFDNNFTKYIDYPYWIIKTIKFLYLKFI